MYEYLDKIIKQLVIRIYHAFQEFKATDFDELNVVIIAAELYQRLMQINREAYLLLMRYYLMLEAQEGEDYGDEMFDLWLDDLLRTPSAVMKYSYESESIRKRDRLVEALIGTNGSVQEIDKAMRYWTQQTGWFALEVADEALKRGRVLRGVRYVKWVSENDTRVCTDCMAMNGKIFPIQNVPPKPHPNCRCRLSLL